VENMAILMPFIGQTKPVDNVIHAKRAFVSHSSVISLSDGKDRKIKKQLANCMKEIQQLMKASSLRKKEKL
jgi:hypothetical protein